MFMPAILFLLSRSHILHSQGREYWSQLSQDSEPIRLLKPPRLRMVYTKIEEKNKSILSFQNEAFAYTVNSLISNHPWCTTKWLLTGGGCPREKSRK